MLMRAVVERLAREERGAVMTLVAIWLPVAILLVSFVVDLANIFEHKRHLQMQADAAALAAASEMGVLAACSNSDVTDLVKKYGGISDPAINAQVGGGKTPKYAINSSTYPDQPGKTDPTAPSGTPCATATVDVKLTEEDVPFWFRLGGVSHINAHARVKAFTVSTENRLAPITAEDPDPHVARAYFVNESNGSTLASVALKRNGTSSGLALWDNTDTPVSVPISAGHIGVRVALGGADSTNCSDPLVTCYDAVDSNHGLVHIQGWSSSGTVKQDLSKGTQDAPLVRSVSLDNGTCTDPYFSAASSTCNAGVRAKVDFGGDPANVGGSLTVSVVGSKTSYPLSYDKTTGVWTSGAVVPVPPAAGPQELELRWKETKGKVGKTDCTKSGNCGDTFGVVQRTFSAVDVRSGPIQLLRVSKKDGSAWVNSAQQGTTATGLVVKLGIKASLGLKLATGAADSPITLAVAKGSGSQAKSLDCDPTLGLKDELAVGCPSSYGVNTGTACPGDSTSLWASSPPWYCVGIKTGNVSNDPAAGLNERILCKPTPANCSSFGKPDACTSPNHWSSYPNIDPTDPRIVRVILVPYNALEGGGSHPVAVTGFATFYVTGWLGQGTGFANPCEGKGDDPVSDQAAVVGHFIKYVNPNEGGAGDQPCDPSALDPCVAVLSE